MEWTADVSAGDWIRERLDADGSPPSIHRVVPRGFEAYARIFHPATRDRPVGVAWPPEPWARHRRAWTEFQRAEPQIDVERVTWADTASAFGSAMHRLAQWHRILGQDTPDPEGSPVDFAGWRYSDPRAGQLEADTLAAAASVLAGHTTTPDDGFAAVWAGWGGLVGHFGYGPSRVLLSLGSETATHAERRNTDMLATSARDEFNDVFRKPTWQPGTVSDEASKGTRLELPNGEHLLFRGGISGLAAADWGWRVPWRDREAEEHGLALDPESPSLIWPADRAWVLVTEVDFDSTVVAGGRDLIEAVCADTRLEAMAIPEGADLSSTGDGVNG